MTAHFTVGKSAAKQTERASEKKSQMRTTYNATAF